MIELLIIGTLVIWGIHCLFQHPFILGEVGLYLDEHLNEIATKPLFACPPCMSSVWGTVVFFTVGSLSIWLWPVYCVALCGLNFIIKEFLYGDN